MSRSGRKLETLVGGGAFFECPRWHKGRLWVSDYWRYQVVAIALDGTTETVAEVPGSPSGLGWLPDGTLLVVSMLDTMLLRVQDGETVVRVDPDRSVSVAADGLLFPNGSVITPDGSTLIVAESWGQRLTAFDIRPDGSLASRREWARFAPPQAADTPGQPARWGCVPDGITLDAEGLSPHAGRP